jgi:squalene-hopene/tetraprenyl-beta-curcumene cyclase
LASQDAVKEALSESIIQGVEFLVAGIDSGHHRIPWPIGFYFAKLWYHEKLYPHIFTASALGKFLRISSPTPEEQWPA